MICLKLATRTGSFQVEVDATPADCGVANINYERKPLAVPGTWNTGTNYADSRYQLPQIDSKAGTRNGLVLMGGNEKSPLVRGETQLKCCFEHYNRPLPLDTGGSWIRLSSTAYLSEK